MVAQIMMILEGGHGIVSEHLRLCVCGMRLALRMEASVVFYCFSHHVSLLGFWSCGRGSSPAIIYLMDCNAGIAEPLKVTQQSPFCNSQVSCIAKMDSVFFAVPHSYSFRFPAITGL